MTIKPLHFAKTEENKDLRPKNQPELPEIGDEAFDIPGMDDKEPKACTRASADLDFLRGPKEKPADKKLTELQPNENLIENSKRRGSVNTPLSYKASLSFLSSEEIASEKEAGALSDRLQQQDQAQNGKMQALSSQLKGAIDKFRSLVFECRGSDKVIEVAKVGDGLDMKVFEDKDSPTPSSEKKFDFNSFVTFFLNKLVPGNPEGAATELASKGVTQINKPTFASFRDEEGINPEEADDSLPTPKISSLSAIAERILADKAKKPFTPDDSEEEFDPSKDSAIITGEVDPNSTTAKKARK